MDSTILEKIMAKRAKRERDWLKQRGLSTHIRQEDIQVQGLFGGDTYENGKIRIGALALIGKTIRHELAHHAHIERSFAPTKKLRKQNSYQDEFSVAFGAISEMLAAISEHETMNGMKLERITKIVLDNYANTVDREAMIRAVRKHILKMWQDLRITGLNQTESQNAILHALYNSKTLTDLEIYRSTMKHYAELRKAGVDTNPPEVIAMRGLAKWRNGGRSAEKK